MTGLLVTKGGRRRARRLAARLWTCRSARSEAPDSAGTAAVVQETELA